MEGGPEKPPGDAPGGQAPGEGAQAEGGRAAPGSGGTGSELSPRDLTVLSLARRTWYRPGARERAIREELDISPTRYYQLLNALLDRPEALAHDPVTVNRLRRVRDARRARR